MALKTLENVTVSDACLALMADRIDDRPDVVNDLTRRHRIVLALRIQADKRLSGKLIIDVTVWCDKRFRSGWIQDIQVRHNAAVVTLFEDVSVPMDQLRRDPLFQKLDPILISVLLLQNWRECRNIYLPTHAIGVAIGEFDPELSDIELDSAEQAFSYRDDVSLFYGHYWRTYPPRDGFDSTTHTACLSRFQRGEGRDSRRLPLGP